MDIDDIKPNELKNDPQYERDEQSAKPLTGVDALLMPENKVEFTPEELEEAKRILTLKLEVSELFNGKYSPKQLAEWAKVRGLWTAIGAVGAWLVKGCI